MSFTIEQLKEIRQKTGLGILEAKSALEQHGSVAAVVDHIRDTAGTKNVFRGKSRGQGRLLIWNDGYVVRFLELRAETDFATRTDIFFDCMVEICMNTIFDESSKMQEYCDDLASRLGEPICIANDYILTRDKDTDKVCIYNHDMKSGSAVIFTGNTPPDHMNKIAMHILGMDPLYISRDHMPASEKEKFLTFVLEELKDSPKPDNIKQKIADGKLSALFKEKCLLDQPFAIDPSITVGQYLEKNCPGCEIVDFYGYTCLPGGQ